MNATSARRMSNGALEERLHSHADQISKLDAAIRDLANATKSAITELSADTKVMFGTLSRKFDEQAERRTSIWIPIASTGIICVGMAAGLSFTILTLRVSPVEDKLSVIQSQQNSLGGLIEKLTDKVADRYVPRSEVTGMNDALSKDVRQNVESEKALAETVKENAAERRATTATKAELAAVQNEASARSAFNRERIDVVETRVAKLEDGIVKREEHERRWSDFQRQLDEQRQNERHDVDEMKTRFENLYPASSVLKDLAGRLQTAESKLYSLEAQTRK